MEKTHSGEERLRTCWYGSFHIVSRLCLSHRRRPILQPSITFGTARNYGTEASSMMKLGGEKKEDGLPHIIFLVDYFDDVEKNR